MTTIRKSAPGFENLAGQATSPTGTCSAETSPQSRLTPFALTSDAISSPVLADGITPCVLPVGRKAVKSGRAVAPASLSAAQAKLRDFSTRGTYGPLFNVSSPSAALQRSLESRLRARLAVYGSPEYALIWKEWDMPSGLPICALRASPRPISGKGCSGWPTPVAHDDGTTIPSLLGQAKLLGWSTPKAHDAKNNASPSEHRRHSRALNVMAAVLGWSTPTAVTDSGGTSLSKWAGTASREKLREAVGNDVLYGALNPAFPCWLMGYPDVWLSCAASAMPSSRNSRRNSSGHSSTPNKSHD